MNQFRHAAALRKSLASHLLDIERYARDRRFMQPAAGTAGGPALPPALGGVRREFESAQAGDSRITARSPSTVPRERGRWC